MSRLVIVSLALLVTFSTVSQQQSPSNLIHQDGYQTSTWGTLGNVKKVGTGSQDVILLPGWGFDHSIFNEFIQRHKEDYRMFAVTIPGFGNTQAPAMPAQPESYGNLFWTKGVIDGLLNLIKRENLARPVIISCFAYSNQIAMRLALDYPDRIGKVIIVSGVAKFTANYPSYEPRDLGQRIAYIDKGLSEMWFKTVTKETWDMGNYPTATFSKDTVKAKRYWEMMSAVPIPVMVRYLCESYSMDLSLEYRNLSVPVLVVVPSFTREFLGENPFMGPFFHSSWLGALPASKQIQMVTINDTHAFIQDDQPEKLDKLVTEFILGNFNSYPPLR